jgi:hypothetical protein
VRLAIRRTRSRFIINNLKNNKIDIRMPAARAAGHGSYEGGTHHE